MTRLEVITRGPVDQPHGAPLLLIHGLWHGAWAWENYQGTFADLGRVSHAISLAGHGKSPGSARRAGLGTHLRDLRAFIDELPSPPILIGHSMGGYLVQCLLAEREFPAAVLLASVPVRGAGACACRAAKEERLLTQLQIGATWSMRPLVATPEGARRWLYSSATCAKTVDKTFRRLCHDSPMLFLRMLKCPPRPLTANRRVLVIGGGKDHFFTHSEFERTAQRFGTPLAFYPEMAHNLTDDNGWKVVATRIDEWLTAEGR